MNISFYLKLFTIFFVRRHLQSMPSTQYSFLKNCLFDGKVAQKVLGLFDVFESHKEGILLKRQIKGFQVGLNGATQGFVLHFKPFYKKSFRSKEIGYFGRKVFFLSESWKRLECEKRVQSLRVSLSTICSALERVQSWLNSHHNQIPDYEKSVESSREKSGIFCENEQRICQKLNTITEGVIAARLAAIRSINYRLGNRDLNCENTIEFLEKLEHEMHKVMNESLQCQKSSSNEQKSLFMINAYQEFVKKAKYFTFLPTKKSERGCVFSTHENLFILDDFFKKFTGRNKRFYCLKKDSRTMNDYYIKLYETETILELIVEFEGMPFLGRSFQDLHKLSNSLHRFYIFSKQTFNRDKFCFKYLNKEDQVELLEKDIKINRKFDESMSIIINDSDDELKKINILFSEQSKYLSKKINVLLKNLFDSHLFLCFYNANFPEKRGFVLNIIKEDFQIANKAFFSFIRVFSNMRDSLLRYTKVIQALRAKLIPVSIKLRKEIFQQIPVVFIVPKTKHQNESEYLLMYGRKSIHTPPGPKVHANSTHCDYSVLLKQLRYDFDPEKWLVWKEEEISKDRNDNNPDKIYDLLAFPKLNPFLFKKFFSIYEARDISQSNIFSINQLSIHD